VFQIHSRTFIFNVNIFPVYLFLLF